jgi:hypothetical protein
MTGKVHKFIKLFNIILLDAREIYKLIIVNFSFLKCLQI